MADEIKENVTVEETTKKVSFKEKFKKAFPWICAGVGTIGAAVVGFKFGKFVTKSNEEMQKDYVINDYLRDRVHDAEDGVPYVIGVMDESNKVTYATIALCDEPDWLDKATEITSETYHADLVMSATVDKQ